MDLNRVDPDVTLANIREVTQRLLRAEANGEPFGNHHPEISALLRSIVQLDGWLRRPGEWWDVPWQQSPPPRRLTWHRLSGRGVSEGR